MLQEGKLHNISDSVCSVGPMENVHCFYLWIVFIIPEVYDSFTRCSLDI